MIAIGVELMLECFDRGRGERDKALKHSFNADSDHIMGIQSLAFDVLDLYTDTDEAREGGKAFTEKRPPDFSPFR